MRRHFVAVTILSPLLLAGCFGYRAGSVAAVDYQSVSVPMFRNSTLSPQLEARVTNAIIRRLQQDGGLRIESKESADVIVNGEITQYERTVLRTELTDTGVPREYRLEITAKVEIKDQRTGNIILASREFSGHTDTFIGTDLQSADYQALPLVADDLARQIVTVLAERW